VTVDTDIAIAVGQTLSGASITGSPLITAQITGTPGSTGTYRISGAQQHVVSEAMTGIATAPTVTFDSVSGSFVVSSGVTGAPSTSAFATGTLAASLLLTSATGAVLSQGAAAATPATFMAGIIAQTTNWASLFTAFDPDGGTGNTQKLAFAAWTNSVAPRYVYLGWDTDLTPGQSVPASSSFGYEITTTLGYSGTVPLYEPTDFNHAAFLSGAIAAINFNKAGGRVSFAYLTQTGLAASVTDITTAVNLGGNPQALGSFGNGYNFVGAFATANQGFVNYQRGTISGPYKWLDSYVNQIWLTNQFQLAAYEYMTQVGAFPYTPAGYANFEIAMQDAIQAGLSFGAYSAGVKLSSTEITEINTAAGANIASTLQTQGWYLQVKDPGATVRASRGSPLSHVLVRRRRLGAGSQHRLGRRSVIPLAHRGQPNVDNRCQRNYSARDRDSFPDASAAAGLRGRRCLRCTKHQANRSTDGRRRSAVGGLRLCVEADHVSFSGGFGVE